MTLLARLNTGEWVSSWLFFFFLISYLVLLLVWMLLPSHPLSKGKKRGYTYTLGSTRMFHLKGQESGRLGKTKILGKFLSFFFFSFFFLFLFFFFLLFFGQGN
ncbi:hypothetical protein LI328DRAFT_120026 [Trichoderma asperelloides]|nr:hypothetical protein LI328DRAFT_120026 [Trichoderma asperelloides]